LVSQLTRRVIIGSAVVVLAVLIALAFVVSRGVSARETPGRVETFVARLVRHLAIPRGARATTSPVPATRDTVVGGLRHFADHCAVCHANDGSGETAFGRSLYPRAPDLRLPDTQSLSDGELFSIIENGIRFTGMPAFGDGTDETAADSWKLVHFIRHLPKLTPDELAEMAGLNPKTPEEFRQEEAIRQFLEGEEHKAPARK
jgi:mono/diheme cytochrome c family protein